MFKKQRERNGNFVNKIEEKKGSYVNKIESVIM